VLEATAGFRVCFMLIALDPPRLITNVRPKNRPAPNVMNSVAPLPPRTSFTDVIVLLGFSLLIAAVFHLVRGQKLRLSEEVAVVCKSRSDSGWSQSGHTDDLVSNVRRFHRSVVAFTVSWLPFLVLVIGNTCCSLLRDAGYLIFPWPLICVNLLFGLALWASQRIRLHLISRLISQGPNQHLQPTRR
jgi:hypothetical protein